jgi:flagellar biosynthesis/type III secretory pathway chaperone
MELLLDDLLESLRGLEDHYRSLLLILENEKKTILKQDTENLISITFEKQSIIKELQRLEDRRMKNMHLVSDALDLSDENPNLSKLLRILKTPHLLQMQTCRLRLLDLMEKVQGANKQNRTLLLNAVELVKGSRELLNNLIVPETVYHKTGRCQNFSQNGRVISNAI